MRSRSLATVSACVSAGLAATFVAFTSVDAQSAHRWSLQASGIYVGVYGDAYDGLNGGPGGEVQVRYSPSAFSIGIGAQASVHKLKDSDPSTNITLAGVFVEPRYVIDIGNDKVAPYVGARIAYLQQSATVKDLVYQGQDVSLELSAGGAQFNAGAGIVMRLSPRLNLDLGASFGGIHFGDVKGTIKSTGGANLGEQSIDGTSGSGQNIVVRIGVSIGLGH